jgi:hypothetical protein
MAGAASCQAINDAQGAGGMFAMLKHGAEFEPA